MSGKMQLPPTVWTVENFGRSRRLSVLRLAGDSTKMISRRFPRCPDKVGPIALGIASLGLFFFFVFFCFFFFVFFFFLLALGAGLFFWNRGRRKLADFAFRDATLFSRSENSPTNWRSVAFEENQSEPFAAFFEIAFFIPLPPCHRSPAVHTKV